ncbi:MAG TPA: DUF4124 domain-containing protein [Xanthomonadaceae bacterium]|nr:DUF4124 domain-containing protein [Xanthomonadaceae bacterium]
MRSTTLMLCAALTGAALAGGGATAAQVFRWTDAQGITHYSDMPPPEGTEHVRIDAYVPAPPAPGEAEAEAEGEADTDTAPAESGPVAVARENCERARKNVEILQASEVVRMDVDGNGASDDLDEAQRAAQLELAQRQVRAFCGE